MTEPKLTKKPKRLRRICWFSLAVVVLTLVCVIAYGAWRAEKQQAAIAEIERLGGVVTFSPSGPGWLRRMLGDEWTRGSDSVIVAFIGLADIITKSDLKPLGDIPNLARLGFFGQTLNDDALRGLSGLTNLEILLLNNTQITDDGIKHLRGLSNLEGLSLVGTQITDDGLKDLRSLTNLEFLALCDTQITDQSLRHLRGLTNLKKLELANTQVTNVGRQAIEKALPNCRVR